MNITDGIVLPVCPYSDDIDTGDSSGPHAGKCQVGVVDAWIPCEPPNVASKLDSIILSQLFMTKHRKLYGNRSVFYPLINDLNGLIKKGIKIHVNGKTQKIYFLTAVIIGDNLGLNGMLGMVESFHLTHCCRICYAGPEEIPHLCKQDKK